MIHPKSPSAERDPVRRSRLLSRILDPEYSGVSPGSLRPLSPSLAVLPQPSVFIDRWGNQHDPDFRPFGSYPVRTPSHERDDVDAWPWDTDDDGLPSSRRSPTAISHSSSSYQSSSSGSRSRSASVTAYTTPASSPPASTADKDTHRPRISPPGKIPRSALFPWTPAQRAVRVQHEIAKRNIIAPPDPPPPVQEEEPEIPLTLVDSRYVPGYGHVLYPPSPSPSPSAQARATSPSPSAPSTKKNRARSHTVPVPACVRANFTTEDAESEEEHDQHQRHDHQAEPQSPSCTHSLRQSVYSFGLKTRLGLHHMKTRLRKASGAAARPVSL
ncbi:hypothetical protein RhiJN_13745 [Ceratobasidium sp. AG-Ba]|nr:hypothetical protein RhiJN_13745 [Ceratobasidium sp. AG-Ba]